MIDEIWKDIKGFEGLYQVSNYGQIKSLKWNHSNTIKLLTLTNNQGYMRTYLFKDKIKYSKYVHDLVAEAFIPNPNHYTEVNHIDENKENNFYLNLEWCNKKYNSNYGNRNKLISQNSAMLRPILQYDLGDNFIKEYPCIISAVKELGIRSSGISNCCAGRYSQSGGYKWKYKEEKENV